MKSNFLIISFAIVSVHLIGKWQVLGDCAMQKGWARAPGQERSHAGLGDFPVSGDGCFISEQRGSELRKAEIRRLTLSCESCDAPGGSSSVRLILTTAWSPQTLGRAVEEVLPGQPGRPRVH